MVSNLGRVRTSSKHSYPKVKGFLTPTTDKAGYKAVVLCKNGMPRRHLLHRLVAQTFIPNRQGFLQVHHKDEDKGNNSVTNLEWVTAKQNLEYSNVIDKVLMAAHKANEKRVLMFNKKGEFIREFESITKAAEYVGSFQQRVSACCKDFTKTTRGCRFKFKED